ncbi:hypothetical protein [Streptomyces sp. NPDC093109]|uniref:hypothetical protein n=1 Tax=Streptomyces sp. NPDC093109 TaxID=3154977 RepID=UPI0034502C7D
MDEAFVTGDGHHTACGICPSRRFPLGEFDVFERPSKECPFDPADGHRYTAERVPVCVHPGKVGLPVGRYKSDGVPLTQPFVLPADVSDLVPYLRVVLYGAAPGMVETLIDRALAEIPQTFPGVDPVAALRRALN